MQIRVGLRQRWSPQPRSLHPRALTVINRQKPKEESARGREGSFSPGMRTMPNPKAAAAQPRAGQNEPAVSIYGKWRLRATIVHRDTCDGGVQTDAQNRGAIETCAKFVSKETHRGPAGLIVLHFGAVAHAAVAVRNRYDSAQRSSQSVHPRGAYRSEKTGDETPVPRRVSVRLRRHGGQASQFVEAPSGATLRSVCASWLKGLHR